MTPAYLLIVFKNLEDLHTARNGVIVNLFRL